MILTLDYLACAPWAYDKNRRLYDGMEQTHVYTTHGKMR